MWFPNGGDRLPPQATERECGGAPLLSLHDQAPGEGISFDHALPLPERRLEPPAAHPVLPPRRPLHRQIRLVPQLPGMRGVAQLERAPRVHAQPHVSGDVRLSVDPRSSLDRKSTRLNSSHSQISYAVFCLKKKIMSKS